MLSTSEAGAVLVPERFRLDPAGARPEGDPLALVAVAELLRVWVEEMEHVPEPAPVG